MNDNYDDLEWSEIQKLGKDRLGSGAGTREEIVAALREDDESPTGAAQRARDAQADAAANYEDQDDEQLTQLLTDRGLSAGGDEGAKRSRLRADDQKRATAEGERAVLIEQKAEEGKTGTEITTEIADELGVEAQGARAYAGASREEGGNVRPADGRFLDPATTEQNEGTVTKHEPEQDNE